MYLLSTREGGEGGTLRGGEVHAGERVCVCVLSFIGGLIGLDDCDYYPRHTHTHTYRFLEDDEHHPSPAARAGEGSLQHGMRI